jgi:hypothetical protein
LQNGPLTNGSVVQSLQLAPHAVVSVIWLTHTPLQIVLPGPQFDLH